MYNKHTLLSPFSRHSSPVHPTNKQIKTIMGVSFDSRQTLIWGANIKNKCGHIVIVGILTTEPCFKITFLICDMLQREPFC